MQAIVSRSSQIYYPLNCTSPTDIEKELLEFDDLTMPERTLQFSLAFLYFITLIFTLRQFYVHNRDNKALLKKNMWIMILIITALSMRIAYLLDSLYILVPDKHPFAEDGHLFIFNIYLGLSSVVFFCLSQFSLLVSRLW